KLRVAGKLVDELVGGGDQQRLFHVGWRSAGGMRYDRALYHLPLARAQIVMPLVVADGERDLLIDLLPIPARKTHTQHGEARVPIAGTLKPPLVKSRGLAPGLGEGGTKRRCGNAIALAGAMANRLGLDRRDPNGRHRLLVWARRNRERREFVGGRAC